MLEEPLPRGRVSLWANSPSNAQAGVKKSRLMY